MPLIRYIQKRFNASSRTLIEQANAIIAEYAQQGFDLTLRQLFYQFVSRDLLPNTTKSYTRLGNVVNDARLAGLIDWDRLVDRTRGVEELSCWDSPSSILLAVSQQFRNDLWRDQECHVEVWIEKEALAGVFEGVCNELRVPYLSCRGYTSQSEMWRGGRRLHALARSGKDIVILHFGDHDPSGIDMSRDITDRLKMFMGGYGRNLTIRRLALNMEQVEEYNPPPNPAKATDSRFADYQEQFGDESWELDALNPATLADLVRAAVDGYRDLSLWDAAVAQEQEGRRLLGTVAERWTEITEGM